MLRAPRAAAAPALGALLLSCAGPPPAPLTRPAPAPAMAAPPAPAAAPASFLLADPDALPAGMVVLLGPEGDPGAALAPAAASKAAGKHPPRAAAEGPPPPFGALVDGVRAVVDGGPLRFAGEVAPSPLTHAMRLPAWLGGGFLFRAGAALYTTASFEGPLRPLVSLPGSVQAIALGPKGLFVRGGNGERWHIAVPSGARLPIDPPGAVDLAALADGRAAAITEGGGVAVSADRGVTWRDARGRLSGPPSGVQTIAGELWLTDDQGRGYRVEPGGGLTAFDQPPRREPRKLRPPDPRWRHREPPLRLAARAGARVDARTAVVAAAGDVAWIDLPSGAIRDLATGVLPPDLTCEAVEVLPEGTRTPPSMPADDVVFVCGEGGRPSVVLSGVIAAEGAPRLTIERTFPTSGPFYASDDGGLVYAGPCEPGADRPEPTACARGPRGQWAEHRLKEEEPVDLDPDADAGAAAPPAGKVPPAPTATAPPTAPGLRRIQVPRPPAPSPPAQEMVRWVPRLDGPPLAIVGVERPETRDPEAARAQPWLLDDLPEALRRDLVQDAQPDARRSGFGVDRRWSAGDDGGLRGWVRGGRAVDVLPGGGVVESAYKFEQRSPDGAYALVRQGDGRAFQTLDRGRTWAEVGAPAALLGRSFQPHGCTRVGCDLGPWVRLGWEAPPPAPTPPPAIAAPAPALPLPALGALICRPAGEPRQATAPMTMASPMDQGLGARSLPFTGAPLPRSEGEVVYARQVLSRTLVNPPHTYSTGEELAPRAILHGFGLEVRDWDLTAGPDPLAGLIVFGPSQSARTFRRELTFLEALDPAGSIRSSGFGVTPLLSLLRAAGAPIADVLSGSLEMTAVTPVLPVDPAGVTELLFALSPLDTGGVVGVSRGAQIELSWATEAPGFPVSAVALPARPAGASAGSPTAAAGLAALWLDDSGASRVLQLAGGAMTPLGSLPPPPSSSDYPANPDALAVGPQGELAILRTPSAGEPPSAEDPALLFPLGGGAPRPLAAWSTLTSAADPACRDAKDGYRAHVLTVRPWLRVGAGRPPDEALTPMLARVRWSEARVCLEAVELPVGMSSTSAGMPHETVLVARLSPPAAAAEVTVGVGLERRLPMSCALTPAPAPAPVTGRGGTP